jgi:putative transposase
VVGLHRSTMRLTPAPITTEEAELRRGCAGSRSTGRAGGGAGPRRWRGEPAGRPTTSASAGCGVEGLRVPQRRRKKRLTGIGVAVGAMSQSDRM